MSKVIKILFILTGVVLTITLISQGKTEKKEVITVPKREEQIKEYPTNINALMSEKSFYIDTLGIVGEIPEGYSEVKSNHFEISGEKDTFIIIGDSVGEYRDAVEVEEALAPLKERMVFHIGGREIKTNLFNFTGRLDNTHMGDRIGIIESENLNGSDHREYISTFFNFRIEDRAVAVGLISENEPDYKKLEEFVKNLKEITYTGTINPNEVNLRDIRFAGRLFHVPNTFKELRGNNFLVLSPVVCSQNLFEGVKILFYLEENPKLMPDTVYRREEVLRAMVLSSDYTSNVIITDFEEEKQGSYQEELLCLVPRMFADLPDEVLNLKVVHISYNVNNKRIHVFVSGKEHSFYPSRILAYKLRRVYQ